MRLLSAAVLTLAISCCAFGQVATSPYGIIQTFAGGGTPLNVPGTSANLQSPSSVAVDGAGNLFFAELNHLVLRLDATTGLLTVVAGNGAAGFSGDNGPATGAQLAYPQGVAVDAAGNLYIADSGNNRIRKVSNGVITTVAGGGSAFGDNGPAANAQLNAPQGIAVDAAGDLYIADTGNSRIRKVSNGVITTVAGNGTFGSGGDSGPATSAGLYGPSGVAVDAAGNLYIADTGNARIRKVSNGFITTVAGNGTGGYSGDNGPATSAELSGPSGVAVDAAGNLYIDDTNNNRIRKVSNGVIATVTGNGTAGFSGDNGPATGAELNLFLFGCFLGGAYPVAPIKAASGAQGIGCPMSAGGGVAVDSAGNVYIADSGNNRIRKVSSGAITTVAGNGDDEDNGPATSALLASPQGVAVDAAGNVYIADSGNNRIRKVSNGIMATVAGNGAPGYSGDNGPATSAELDQPDAVAVDAAGNLYVASTYDPSVRKVSIGVITPVAGNGTYGYSGDGGPATGAELSAPAGLAFDSAGNLYIADPYNNRIREVSNGVIGTVAGIGPSGGCIGPGPAYAGDNGPATSAQLSCPFNIAVDAADNLYIADYGNNRIRKVSNGVITTVAGNGTAGFSGDNGPATGAGLYGPGGVAVDSAGNLYIADSNNQRVRRVSNGVITTVAGNGTAGYSGDNGPATSAELSYPFGIALDSAGNLYVADVNNNRVRIVTAVYSITTPSALPSGVTGTAYLQTLTAANGIPPYTWSVTSGVLPAGLTLSSGGVIAGTPTVGGVATFGVKVTDASGSTASQSFTLTITYPPLAITTPSSLPAGVAGTAYSQTLAATGGDPPYTWVITSGALPALLSLSYGGVIGGIPTATGISTFSVNVYDNNLHAASQTFTLTITLGTLTIATPSLLPSGLIGAAYSQALTATGGIPPYAWRVTSGTWPAGLSISSAGVIAGTPTSTGTYSFTAQVTDSTSSTASQAFSLTVTAAGVLPRQGVISQVAAGGGWVTTIWLVNRTSAPVQTSLVFHGDDGGPLTLPLTVTLGASVQQVTASTLNEAIAPNTTLLVATGALATNVEGWADVLGNGPLSGFAVFQYAGGSEAAVPLQTQIGTSFTLPFDNTGGFSTGVAIANLSGSPARITASVWDGGGNLLLVQPVNLTKTDAGGNGHDAFMLPDRLAVTAGRRGIVQFQGNPGSAFVPAGQLTGLGLRTDPNGLFTSIPTIVP